MKTKHLIFSSILLLIVSCRENVKTYNDKSKPLNERILTFSQNYVNNNLKSFNNRSMSVKTSDIFRECDSGKYYVFMYDSYSSGLEYMIKGEVIINYDSQTKEISLFRDNLIEDMSKSVYYFLSESCKNDKIQFSSERNQSQNFKNNSQKNVIITSNIDENNEISEEELFYNQTLLNKNSKNKNLHESVKVYKNSVYSLQTKKFIVRVDELENGELRYSSWGGNKNISNEPSLILYNGERIFEGSGGNNYTEFNNGNLKYIVWENRISDTGIPYRLEVLQNDKLILEQTGDVF